MDKTEKKVFTYTLHVNGVFGRNRKAKRAFWEIAEAEVGGTQPTEEELKTRVTDMLKAEKVKPGAGWSLVKQEETLSEWPTSDGHGILQSRSFMVFSGDVLFRGTT